MISLSHPQSRADREWMHTCLFLLCAQFLLCIYAVRNPLFRKLCHSQWTLIKTIPHRGIQNIIQTALILNILTIPHGPTRCRQCLSSQGILYCVKWAIKNNHHINAIKDLAIISNMKFHICYNMMTLESIMGSERRYKSQLNDCIQLNVLFRQMYRDRKQINVWQGLGKGKYCVWALGQRARSVITRGNRSFLEVTKMF